jgi:hypothetical protein
VEEQIRLKEAGLNRGVPDRIPQMKTALARADWSELPYDDTEPSQLRDATITIPISVAIEGTKAGH